MKILTPGREQKGWSVEAKCTGKGNGGGGCGATLLVEQEDLFHTYSSCRDETETFTTFRCGQCGVDTDLQEARVPTVISMTLPSKSAWLARQDKPLLMPTVVGLLDRVFKQTVSFLHSDLRKEVEQMLDTATKQGHLKRA